MMSRILFVYPNKEGYPVIPISISILCGILESDGHETALFDITFMMSERYDHDAREKAGLVQKIDIKKYWGSGSSSDIYDELKKGILRFEPDLIAFTVIENNYGTAKRMFEIAKEVRDVPIVVGGLFPTVAPEFFVSDKNVDLICIGEGEYAFKKVVESIDNINNCSSIPNIINKLINQKTPSSYHRYYNWDLNDTQDWSLFDERHLLKPFMGKVWRTGYFEMSRGCPFNCSYCTNELQQEVFKSLGRYHRDKPMAKVIDEIAHFAKKYSLELVFFNDENYLMMSEERFNEFCDRYGKHVDLPFYIMTRADTLLNTDRVAKLKEIGCATIGIGIESGNEEIRRYLLNKKISNSIYERAFKNCHKYGIRTTANIIIGLPFETEQNIMESAELCRKFEVRSLSLAIFAPYYGSKLRSVCIGNGFMQDRYYDEISMVNKSVLDMPQISKEKLDKLYVKFSEFVYK